MPGRKRKKLSRSNNGQSESKGSPKLFMEGDPIFCLMDMGVWWPGFVLDVCANGVVSVAFWNENSIVKRSLSKLVKFDKNSSLIISSIEKLEKKKRHSLIKKYKDDLCFASSAELSSDTSIPSGDSTSLVSEESMTVQSSVASMDATVPCTRTAEETSGMMCSATVSTETSSSIRGATLSKEMSPTIWATPEIDSTERTCSPAIPVESTLCEITFGSSAERSSDTFIPSGDSTSLVSEESMTVQSSVASMDATVPCTSTAEETSGMMCSATVSTETSSSIRGATLSKEMSPTIWATPEIDSTERTSSPAIPVESTLCEITFGSSAERSSDTFIPSGDSTSLVSEESMTVQSSVASMDATVPCTSTAEETSGMMCSATVSTETSSSIRGATLSKEMSPTIWATPEIDSTETRSNSTIPFKSTSCEITFGSSEELSSDTFIPSGDSTSLVSEESMTVQSSVASMDATVPCTSTAEETSGMMCSATVSTETSSSIRGATLSKEMSPTIWATPEIDSTERTSSPAIPVESTLCEITFGSSAERSSDTFIPSGDSTSLVSEESMTVQSSVASMKKMGVMSKDATVPHSSTVQKTPGMISSATVSTETSSSIRGATLSEEMSPTIWTTPEIDSTERTSSPAIPVESTSCEITIGSSAERSSDTFIPSGACTTFTMSELSAYLTSVVSENSQINSDTLHTQLVIGEMPQKSLLPKPCKALKVKLPAFDQCFDTHTQIYRNTINTGLYSPTENHDNQARSDDSILSTEINHCQSINCQPQIFSATFEADLPASDDQSVNPIRETLYRECTSLKPKGQKLLLADMNFSDDEEEFGETDSDRESVYIPDFDCESVDDESDVSDEWEFPKDTPAPDKHAPDKHAPDKHAPDKHAPEEHAPEEHAPDKHAPEEHAPDKHAPDNCENPDLLTSSVPFKRNILPNKCILDETNTKIYSKKYEQNSSNSKHGRLYDTVHSCMFCYKLVTHIQTHLQHKHRNEKEVKEILDLKEQIDKVKENDEYRSNLKKRLKNLQTLIRNKGNNNHNLRVLAAEEGEILLTRRRKSNQFNVKDYGPCPNCQEWIVLENITKHMVACPIQENIDSKGAAIIQSKIMAGKISSSASTKLKTEVFPSMIRDKTTEIAQGDHLITVLGNIWLMKNAGNKLRRKNFTSFRMRLSAKLLSLLREDSQIPSASMHYFIAPKQFDRVVSCAVKACEEDENADLKNPSTAIKLGYDLSRLANAKLGIGIKEGNDKAKTEASEFLQLLRMEWSVKVTKLARITLDVRHFNKRKELPDPSDIEKIAAYLVREIKNLDLTPNNSNEIVFREAVVLAEARLLLYNRRRPGELECLSIEAYKNRSMSVDEANMALRSHLTDFEKMLLKTQDLVEIRGKTGRGVPVLIPKETNKVLEYLSDPVARQMASIRPENKYMFANTGRTVVRAGESLDLVKFRSEVALRFPERIYANNLRKHTATIAQALNLNDTEMKYICNHLGHTQKVHDLVYRQTSGMIERLDIAKLMLIQEFNVVGKYQNKKLSEIQFDELGTLERKIQDQDQEQQDTENAADQGKNVDDDIDIEDDFTVCRKKAKKSERVRWSPAEEEEIKKYFSRYFEGHFQKKCPSREHCLDALKKSKENGGTIFKRKWETLKKKVSNMLVKIQV
ncbi:uncharacterized protein [Magallana gigas]|uniref:uncharacterized protein isoform X1 n=2 Tax=Magallana gigas TaxID=29159 RepID=UPI0033427200